MYGYPYLWERRAFFLAQYLQVPTIIQMESARTIFRLICVIDYIKKIKLVIAVVLPIFMGIKGENPILLLHKRKQQSV